MPVRRVPASRLDCGPGRRPAPSDRHARALRLASRQRGDVDDRGARLRPGHRERGGHGCRQSVWSEVGFGERSRPAADRHAARARTRPDATRANAADTTRANAADTTRADATHATSTDATTASQPAPEVKLSGRLQSLSGTCPAIRFTIGGTAVTTNAQTSFSRGKCTELRNNDDVEVKGRRQPDGSVVASEVKGEK